MMINRHNYEEYFLLYVDNELNADERIVVEEFVQQHPDLKEELNMLQQSLVKADEQVVFENKELLYKLSDTTNIVTAGNCEEYFVLYADDELSNEEKDLVEQFVYSNPQYQAEFELIHKAKLTPESNVVFPNKETLYKKEKDDKVIPMHWWRIAAAAIVLFFIGGLGWYLSIRNIKTGPSVVTTIHENKIEPNAEKSEQQNKPSNNIATVNTSKQTTDAAKKDKGVLRIASKEKGIQKKSTIEAVQVNKIEKTDEDGNFLAAKSVTPKAGVVKVNRVSTEKISPGSINPSREMQPNVYVIDEAVGKGEEPPVDYAVADTDEIEILNTKISKKNSLRGVFRKASRYFEKATNIQTTENNRGLRIANFEIALK